MPETGKLVNKISGSPRLVTERLEEAGRLVARRKWKEAQAILVALDQRYPGRTDVLSMLLHVSYELKDMDRYLEVCENLLAIDPDDQDMTLALAGAYLSNSMLGLALQTFRQFAERWPEHERTQDVLGMAAGLEADLRQSSAEVSRPFEEILAVSVLHDRMQAFMKRNQVDQAIQQGEEIIARYAWFVPVYNNLSQIYWQRQMPERAIATARQILETEPENIHALSNLVRFSFLVGETDQARQYAAALKASTAIAHERSVKIAEALSYLGDDQGVLEIFAATDQSDRMSPGAAMLYHLAAAAAFRQGKSADAERHWRRALRLQPGLELARDNLDDLRKQAGERHAPWAYTLQYFVFSEVLDELVESTKAKAGSAGEDYIDRATQRWAKRHPAVVALVPYLLERGDPMGREFAFRLASILNTPEMLEALKVFGLGRFGPDSMRMQAVQTCMQAGLIPSGMVRFWTRGQWRDVIMMAFEIYNQPESHHSAKVQELLESGIEAMHQGDGARTEALLRQAIKLEPNAPDLLNNLGAALEAQGHQEEAQSLLLEVVERFPDYFFGQTGMVMVHIHRGELDLAQSILERLGQQQRMHVTEFAAFCAAYIELFLAEDNKAAARSWLEMWENADPENPRLDIYRLRIGSGRGRPKWKKHR